MTSPPKRLFIALYTDEDVPSLLAVLLRERGFEATSVAEWETWGMTDEEQLKLATERGHALLTFNRDDFIALARAWSQEGRQHAGIVISPQHGLKTIGEYNPGATYRSGQRRRRWRARARPGRKRRV